MFMLCSAKLSYILGSATFLKTKSKDEFWHMYTPGHSSPDKVSHPEKVPCLLSQAAPPQRQPLCWFLTPQITCVHTSILHANRIVNCEIFLVWLLLFRNRSVRITLEAGRPDSFLPLIMNSIPLYEYISQSLFIPLLVGFTCDRVSGCHKGEFTVTLLSESSVDT